MFTQTHAIQELTMAVIIIIQLSRYNVITIVIIIVMSCYNYVIIIGGAMSA